MSEDEPEREEDGEFPEEEGAEEEVSAPPPTGTPSREPGHGGYGVPPLWL